MAQREKTLSYRRAEWFRDTKHDLEKCLRQANAQLRTIDDRTSRGAVNRSRSPKKTALSLQVSFCI